MRHRNTSKNSTLKVLLVGGGSGGHVTPLRAIAKSLSDSAGPENIHTTFVCEENSIFDDIMDQPYVHAKKKISAGKFRRYHGDSFIEHILDVKTQLKNSIDFFKFVIGCIEALFYLMSHRPHVIFLKGGFVCVPIGWAASLLRIPYVTHDSDAVPGLANRLTAKKAAYNLVAMPGDYPYAKDKTVVTGVPIDQMFFDTTKEALLQARNKLSVPEDAILVLVTGGGLGAQKMNASVVSALDNIAQSQEDKSSSKEMYIVHISGKSLYEETLDLYEATQLNPDKVDIVDFTTDMVSYIHAADIVISRAGATAIAECAAAKKACIFIPGAHLTGGQQIHNASLLEKKDAAIVVLEQDVDGITSALRELASNDEKREQLGDNIAPFSIHDSTEKIIQVLYKLAHFTVDSDDVTKEAQKK